MCFFLMTSFLFIYSFFKVYLFGCTGSLLLGAGLWASHGMGCFVVVHGLLIAVASFLAEHSLQQLWHMGSVAVVRGLCGIFLDQESNPCLLHRQVDSCSLYHQRSPIQYLYLGFIPDINIQKKIFEVRERQKTDNPEYQDV